MVLPSAERECGIRPQRRRREVDPHPARPRHPGGVDGEPVAEVEHRGGSPARREHAIADGRGGRELRPDLVGELGPAGGGRRDIRLARRIDAAREQQGETCGRPPQVAGDGDHVTDARARPQHGRPALEVAERGHREGEHARRGEVAAHDAAAGRERVARVPQAVGDALEQ